MATKNALFDVKWTLVPRASKFTTPSWNPSRETRVYKQVRGGYELTVSGVRAGKPYTWSYRALYDGKDHAVKGRKDVDAIEAYKVNDRTTIGFFKKRGEEVAGYKRTISIDGRSLSVVASGINDDGTIYFDRIEYKQA